ncbi:DUF3558 domain-containing protein [Nocardia arthritidis]|uniref:DUF3558 domain-containing protein n=1 Tax=Nocardia arthritidis TaxID=228602 RepID=A0A6G9YBY6_9NOCA|nr:DUF3558 domain-containing protein [Nocardia arthritidis]QIS10739.1 DUF3558 domain-containing protein [Nocardia arthritidis]
MATLAGALLLASGCGPDKQGQPSPTTANTSAATAALWDPCTQIPEQKLRQLGLDPSSKTSGIAGVEEPGYKACGWYDPEHPVNFNITVFTTIYTLDDVKKKKDNTGFSDVSVQGRNGLTYRTTGSNPSEACTIAFPASQGSIQIIVFNSSAKGRQIPSCDRAKNAADTLSSIFPN